jgi:16S rRNA (guanine966-N2)-methyltransferase
MRIVAGQWGGRRIAAPPGRDTRPTPERVREAWMSSLSPVLPGARVLDLFAGSGALGLEALSRGAASATFVEQGAQALRALRANLKALGAEERATVVQGDVMRYLRSLEADAFDVALADPPYGKGYGGQLATALAEVPFAGVLCIEHGRDDPVAAGAGVRTKRYGDTFLTFISADP